MGSDEEREEWEEPVKKAFAVRILADFAICAICFVFMAMCIYPFYYVIIYSVSDPNQAAAGLLFTPKGFSLETFKSLFRLNDIPGSLSHLGGEKA